MSLRIHSLPGPLRRRRDQRRRVTPGRADMTTDIQPPLAGKVALVTGGSLGIGTALERDLPNAGADVPSTSRSHADEAQALAQQVEAIGRRAQPLEADVASFHRA